ncbi:hypothetical protein DL93DRAFT_2069671 [Clavulina sp. PMI_390]|nr:hypothetical protein DL93DRAFT_2069671 [Clavulina sp. PMI_390]
MSEAPKKLSDTLWTVEFTFHGAKSVPVADFPSFTSDPFLACSLAVPAHPHFNDDNPLVYRSPTVRAELNPTWEAKWRVAGIPASGFKLVIRLRDEDPSDHDDRLGSLTIREENIHEGLFRDHVEYDVKKRRGSVRAYFLTYLASAVSKNISVHARFYMSIKVIGKTPNQDDRRVYTVGPHWWSVHYSPLIGKITGTRAPDVRADDDPNKPSKVISTFQANKIQLGGPVPAELKHQFVGYRPFIDWLFKQQGIRGRILHFGLKRQYSLIYYYSKSTEYGAIECDQNNAGAGKTPDGDPVHEGPESEAHATELARRFLEMTHWGEAGRLYTYIVTLDGEWHFTETGPEFAIDMLSKHSMHANVAPVIAFSGEFFVQELNSDSSESDNAAHADGSGGVKGGGGDDAPTATEVQGHPSDGSAAPMKDKPSSEPADEEPSSSATGGDDEHQTSTSNERKLRDPKRYELVIDNDSGTYRPKKELLPVFEKWLSGPDCLGGLGNVRAMDGFDDKLKGMKEERAKIKAEYKKRRGEPERPKLVQASSSLSSGEALDLGRGGSVSSDDMDDLVVDARKKEREAMEAEQEANGNDGDGTAKDKESEARKAEGKAEAARDA